jgi:hypothetical protein
VLSVHVGDEVLQHLRTAGTQQACCLHQHNNAVQSHRQQDDKPPSHPITGHTLMARKHGLATQCTNLIGPILSAQWHQLEAMSTLAHYPSLTHTTRAAATCIHQQLWHSMLLASAAHLPRMYKQPTDSLSVPRAIFKVCCIRTQT